jgi:hypothetical protein
MYTYGDQHPVTYHHDKLHVAQVMLVKALGKEERAILERGEIEYLVVDRRITDGLPITGVYVEQGEPDTFKKVSPLAPAALDKFDTLAGVDRLFDNGAIQLFDVRALADGTAQ